MNQYLVLYRSETALTSDKSVTEMFAAAPPEHMAAGMAAWQAWYQNCGAAILSLGAPLDKSTIVANNSSVPKKTAITGYSLMRAASMEEAVELTKDHPHLRIPGSSIQILESVTIPV